MCRIDRTHGLTARLLVRGNLGLAMLRSLATFVLPNHVFGCVINIPDAESSP